MNKILGWSLPVVLVLVIAGFWYFRMDHDETAPPPAAVQQQMAEEKAAINYPIVADTSGDALPALDESDVTARDALEKLLGRQAVAEFLIPKDFIRHFVATVDNLPRNKLAPQLRPMRGPAGAFKPAGAENAWVLNERNYARYQPLMQWVQAADVKQMAGWYRRFYPLLQEAYVSLGYPNGYFNDRVVEVINHLLSTPEIQEPIKLVQPNVFYQFADPQLESRSAGQKTLLRMGPANIATIKIKLRELRTEITR